MEKDKYIYSSDLRYPLHFSSSKLFLVISWRKIFKLNTSNNTTTSRLN